MNGPERPLPAMVDATRIVEDFGVSLSTAYECGYSLDTISKLFGHTTAKLVRDVYADVEGEELDAIIARERAAARTQSAHAVPKLETKPDESGN